MSARVLVVCAERIGARMAGPAIRAYELARVLAADCEVTVAAPPGSVLADERLRLLSAGFEDYAPLLAALREHDVVVAQQLPPRLLTHVAKMPIRFVADMYNPTVMEVLEAVARKPPASARRTQETIALQAAAQCAVADLVLCASERQRDLWLGGMAMRGLIDLDAYREDPTYRSRIAVVPFGVPDEPPEGGGEPVIKGVWPGIAAADRVLLWGGGIWSWLDPITPIRAVEELRTLDPPVHLFFMGLGRPLLGPSDAPSGEREARDFARARGLEGERVHFNTEWVPYAERARYLLEADLGVSAHLDHLESRFSFRTRLLDCVWTGLPVVASSGDALGDLVERGGLGRAVAPGDHRGFAAACRELLEDDGAREEAVSAMAAAAPDLRWSAVARPLVDFCLAGRAAPPRPVRRDVLRSVTLRQYPRLATEAYREAGPMALAAKLGRNAARAAAERLPRRGK